MPDTGEDPVVTVQAERKLLTEALAVAICTNPAGNVGAVVAVLNAKTYSNWPEAKTCPPMVAGVQLVAALATQPPTRTGAVAPTGATHNASMKINFFMVY